ncbi:MAG: hypothetical protein AAB152_16575, partial [Candidatus Coatesbacteria bacterium]
MSALLGYLNRNSFRVTPHMRERALQTVGSSLDHAAAAVNAEAGGDLEEAYRQWDIVFNNYFPKA